MPYWAGMWTSPKQDFHTVVGAPGSPQPSFTTSASKVDWCQSASEAIYRGRGQSQGRRSKDARRWWEMPGEYAEGRVASDQALKRQMNPTKKRWRGGCSWAIGSVFLLWLACCFFLLFRSGSGEVPIHGCGPSICAWDSRGKTKFFKGSRWLPGGEKKDPLPQWLLCGTRGCKPGQARDRVMGNIKTLPTTHCLAAGRISPAH